MLVAWGAPQLGRVMESLVLPFLLFGLVIALLAVAPFGREHSLRTLSLLLSGPVSRLQLWQEKVAVLALAELTVALCFWVNVCWLVPSLPDSSRLPPEQLAWVVAVMTAVAFGGGLWASLTVQNFTAAILQTVMMPVGVLLAHFLTLATLQSVPAGEFLVEHQWGFATALLVVYALAGVAGSLRSFLRAEATPGLLEREIEFRGLFGWLRQGRKAVPSQRHPRATWALVAKELHLQQFVLLGVAAGAGFSLACCGLAALLNDTYRERVRGAASALAAILTFTTPCLAGVMGIGEEKRLGTLNAQHCLPVTRRRVFLVKLICTEAVGAVGGLVLATMLWLLQKEPGNASSSRELLQGLLWLGVVYPLAAAAVAFYASSVTRSLLQAFGFAVVVGAVFGYALGSLTTLHRLLRFWDPQSLGVIGLSVELGFLWWRSWCNYRRDACGWQALWRDALALLLVGLATFEALNAIALFA